MNALDVILVVMIVGYCAYVLLSKKKHGCSGNCSQCSGCERKK